MNVPVDPLAEALAAERRRVRDLEHELGEARELLAAISSGEVDAVVVDAGDGASRVYTLKDADRPYRMLIEEMREGAMTLSADGVVLYANQAITQMLGAAHRSVIGQRFETFIVDEPEERVRFGELLSGGKGELRLRDPDQGRRPVQMSINLLRAEEFEGETVLCAVVTDLTEEKRHSADIAEAHTRIEAAAARRAGEGLARLIIDGATDYAIITTDMQGRVTTWNSGAENIFGWPSGDVLGETINAIWTVEDRERGIATTETERATETGRAEYERWHVRRDGSRFWGSGLTMPLRGGADEQLGFIKILRDRSRSRATEAALEDSEARLRFTLEAGRLGAWELDLVSGVMTTSDICRVNFGRRPQEEFSYEQLLNAVHVDDRERMRAAVTAAIDGRTDYDIEYRVVVTGGATRWVQVRGQTVYAADGTALRMAGVSLDTTDRKLAEEQLKRLNDTLEGRVLQEVAERYLAEEALRQSQKMEAVGQLTGGVAHDFNNLLTIIKGSTDLLRRSSVPEERKRRYIDAISETVDRASKLTSQLLAFARRQSLKPEVFDASARVREVGDMLRTIVGARISITLPSIGDAAYFVEADASQFDTALVNLAVNARDAMDGAGRLLIEVVPSPGEVGGKEISSPAVVVRVTDTGCGIEPDQLERIFEPFFTTKEVGKGTGLGLSQVYGFAKQSGGDVMVESVPGAGATFTLLFPRVAEGAGVVATEGVQLAPVDGRGRRVLVVEDNVAVGTFSTQFLHDLGYRTTWAATANEALGCLDREADQFDVVFTDVVMPGMSGVDLALQIRRRFASLPVVLTSGYSHVLAEDGRHGFELLKKPYSLEALSQVLQRVLREDLGLPQD